MDETAAAIVLQAVKHATKTVGNVKNAGMATTGKTVANVVQRVARTGFAIEFLATVLLVK